MTLPLYTQVARLRNQNQMLQESLKHQQQYSCQLEERLSKRTASNFVQKLQQQERPVTDYYEYHELQQQNAALGDQVILLNRQIAKLDEELLNKSLQAESLYKQLLTFQDNMKQLISTSRQLNYYNDTLKAENRKLAEQLVELRQNQQGTEDLQNAFQTVQSQLTLENDELREEIIELKDELLKAQQSAYFSLDYQKAAAQQAMLWQQNYQTLLSYFKSQKQLEKSVRFEDIASVIYAKPLKTSSVTDSLRPEVSLPQQAAYHKEIALDKQPALQLIDKFRQKKSQMAKAEQNADEIEIDLRNEPLEQQKQEDILSFKDLDSRLNTIISQKPDAQQQDVSVTRICKDLCGTTVENEIELLEHSIGEMIRLKEEIRE